MKRSAIYTPNANTRLFGLKRDVDRYVSQIPEREVTLQKCTDKKTLHKSYVISCYNGNNQLKEGKLSNKPITTFFNKGYYYILIYMIDFDWIKLVM